MTGNQILGKALYDVHPQHKEASLLQRRFKHKDILPLISALDKTKTTVTPLGQSVEHRDIYEIKIGEGEKNIMLWSQMHGDEPTSTMAIFDMIHFLQAEDSEFMEVRNTILSQLELCFIPMLNPDGVQRFQRRNAAEVDLNRDAVAMACPESRILKAAHQKNKPAFGFNLHDQSKYYNIPQTNHTATHSFLAPAYNYSKDVNPTRKAAMQGIALMHEVLEQLLPNHAGRYNDDFEPRAFGDNIQLWGTSTILVEAGGLRDDPDKQEIRRMHFAILLTLLYNIAIDAIHEYDIAQYWAIPENDRKLNDLIIRNVHLPSLGRAVDISINHTEVNDATASHFHLESTIEDLGDLSTYFGYTVFDAKGLAYCPAKTYHKTLENTDALDGLDISALLAKGIGIIKIKGFKAEAASVSIPLLLLAAEEATLTELKPGNRCAFFLEDGSGIKFAVIKGKMTKL